MTHPTLNNLNSIIYTSLKTLCKRTLIDLRFFIYPSLKPFIKEPDILVASFAHDKGTCRLFIQRASKAQQKIKLLDNPNRESNRQSS